ncbi:hypothetical protein [Bradyrhizobium sp. DOA1]|uniref:hypothetical protein n=1 Tax=Bradyrhizobium sp. DOA1 TaxID=1126616 RepID=UPI00077C29DE|nr:hypothetical protein [Bradyrhizobium sp. DOA1]KYG97885.1 hypothetical protein SE91_04425 [Bradyrhizobium sp. DOA1]
MADTKSDLAKELAAIEILTTTLEPLGATARANVIDYVFKRLGIGVSASTEAAPTMTPPLNLASPPPALAELASRPADILSLKEEKQPRSVNDMVALVAYYLAHLAKDGERRDYIIADDISKYFNQARFRLPEGPARMALTNAKNAGYLEAKDRGQYRLSAVGHNLVVHRMGTDEAQGSPARRKKRKPKVKGKSNRRG